jgi:Domain of unknown function (DUF4126)
METLEQVALAAGLSWASGIRLYAALFLAGGLARLGVIDLPASLHVLTHSYVLAAAGFMLLVEFFADKIPGLDSIWDGIHTFIRIPAGALLAAGTFANMEPALMVAAGILGGAIASGSHATKAGSRALINASPEPFSNWAASLTEDVIVPAGLLAALKWPIVFLVLLLLFMLVALWMIPRLWRGLRWMFARLRGAPAT